MGLTRCYFISICHFVCQGIIKATYKMLWTNNSIESCLEKFFHMSFFFGGGGEGVMLNCQQVYRVMFTKDKYAY